MIGMAFPESSFASYPVWAERIAKVMGGKKVS